MPLADEETALTSPMESLDDRSNHSTTSMQQQQQQQQQQQIPATNHIPATRGSIRQSDAGQNNKKKAPPKLLHP